MAGKRYPRLMWRRVALGICFLFLVGILVPPLQVATARFSNPSRSPMQLQREIEAWRIKRKLQTRPIQWVPLEKIPLGLVHYIWASEDQEFFNHRGFDFHQLRKAMAESNRRGDPVRGSSTITMQCARSVFLWQGRSYLRKTLEAYYTFWMETFLNKRRILELYLNHIEWGPGIYGVGAAARAHFGKSPMQLSDREMLSLAAILPNPLKWSPTNPNCIVQRKIRRVQRLASRAPFPQTQFKKN